MDQNQIVVVRFAKSCNSYTVGTFKPEISSGSEPVLVGRLLFIVIILAKTLPDRNSVHHAWYVFHHLSEVILNEDSGLQHRGFSRTTL